MTLNSFMIRMVFLWSINAVKYERLDILQHLMKKPFININEVDKDNKTALYYAFYRDNPKILDYLLLNNIDVHSLYIPILGVYDFEFAQVCKGGIDISMVNDNLSLKKDKNVFAMGEVLDVDAICGGYNLMFAFASAIEVFKEIKNEIQNK